MRQDLIDTSAEHHVAAQQQRDVVVHRGPLPIAAFTIDHRGTGRQARQSSGDSSMMGPYGAAHRRSLVPGDRSGWIGGRLRPLGASGTGLPT